MSAALDARSYVDGEWVVGDRREDVNPAAPGEIVAHYHALDSSGVDAALDAATRASTEWAARPAPERGEVLHRAATLLTQRADAIGVEFAREEGKTLAEAVGEVRRAAAIFRYFAGQTLEPDGETYPSHTRGTLLFARREPLGVIVAITPWNFPVAIPAWKMAPALAYGNCVVWKPAEIVPLTSVRLTEVLIDANLPPGVLNLVLGSGSQLGDALVGDPRVAAVTFTGSNDVGRRLRSSAAEHGVKIQLELGGKNPAIILADADLDQAATLVARGAFLSAGQKCTATSRVIVEEAIFEPFGERLTALASQWVVGDPLDPDTAIGPLASEAQLQNVVGYLEQASADGGRFLAGGAPLTTPSGGYFVPPTVVAGLGPASRVVREEIFGPVAAMLPASGFEEALALANDTPYGLSASLFTRDLNHALAFAHEARAGVVKINQESAGLELHVPFGGQKQSSNGSREQGKVARDFFTSWKTVYVDAAGS